jgi:diacylglycerol kinase (ATP)
VSSTREVFIFANPIAGRGRGQSTATQIARGFERQGIRVRSFWNPPQTITDAELLSDSPPLAAIAVGGDGTLRAAVERLLRFAGDDASRMPPVLIIALGTANLMSQHLGIKWEPGTLEHDVVRIVLDRKIALLDAARANARLFLLMAGVGIDAAIVHQLDRLRNGPIDLTSYALPALLVLQGYDYPPLRVLIDGECVMDNQPAMAFVGNAPEYGTGFPILINARSDDSLLDVCVLPCRSRWQVLKLLMTVATGDHIYEEGVVYQKGRSIRIDSPGAVPVQIDGEASGHTPLSIELLPSRLPFIVP